MTGSGDIRKYRFRDPSSSKWKIEAHLGPNTHQICSNQGFGATGGDTFCSEPESGPPKCTTRISGFRRSSPSEPSHSTVSLALQTMLVLPIIVTNISSRVQFYLRHDQVASSVVTAWVLIEMILSFLQNKTLHQSKAQGIPHCASYSVLPIRWPNVLSSLFCHCSRRLKSLPAIPSPTPSSGSCCLSFLSHILGDGDCLPDACAVLVIRQLAFSQWRFHALKTISAFRRALIEAAAILTFSTEASFAALAVVYIAYSSRAVGRLWPALL